MRAARRLPIALAVGFQLLFFVSVFAGLGAPLLWQDEAETAMFGRSVLEFGVPKIHVGRNVLYGAPLPLELGRNEALDAYVGSPWGQYFFAAPAVAWSDGATDLATRTWRVRLPFAIAGWLGVVMLGAVAASVWPAAAGGRAWFWLGFGACLVSSVSLQLHLREVRYYPLVVFALGVVAQLEVRRHVRGDLPPLRHTLLLAPVLWCLFELFYPAFAAVGAVAGGALGFSSGVRARRCACAASAFARGAAPYVLACAAALPLVALFQIPAQSRSFFEYFAGPASAFGHQLASAGFYLLRYEFFAPVVLGALALALARRQLGADARDLRSAFAACDLVLALALIWTLVIARTPLFFSRYLVPLSPLLAAACVLQVGCLVALRRTHTARTATAGLVAVALAWAACAAVRVPELRGRLGELREPYRGPLDHVIPYLATAARPREARDRDQLRGLLVHVLSRGDDRVRLLRARARARPHVRSRRDHPAAMAAEPARARASCEPELLRAARISGREHARQQPARAVPAQSGPARPPLPLSGARRGRRGPLDRRAAKALSG